METVSSRTTLYDLFPNEAMSNLVSNSISIPAPASPELPLESIGNFNYSGLIKAGLCVIGIGTIIYVLHLTSSTQKAGYTEEGSKQNT